MALLGSHQRTRGACTTVLRHFCSLVALWCASRRYSNADPTNNYVHLTNVAIQKSSDTYNEEVRLGSPAVVARHHVMTRPFSCDVVQTGGKWDLRSLKLHMISTVGKKATDKLFMEIQKIVIRSLQSVQKIMINDKHCFELYVSPCTGQVLPWCCSGSCLVPLSRTGLAGMGTTSCLMTSSSLG